MNEKVIIRADRAGVFYGPLANKEGNEVQNSSTETLETQT